MRFNLLVLPAVAVLADAAALAAAEPASSGASTAAPVTLKNRSAAVSSILASMSSQYSKDHPATTTTSTTTTKATGGKKSSTAAAVKPTTPGKKPSSSKASSTSKVSVPSKATPTTSIKVTLAPSVTTRATTSTVGSSTTSKSKKVRRQASSCAPQPVLYTYTPAAPTSTDVVAPLAAFLQDNNLASAASAQATIPGFTTLYSGLLGVAQKPLYYMFYTDMSSYNATACGEICTNSQGCRSFNMYFERSPTVAPGNGCVNPTAYTAIRCAFYSTNIKSTDVLNNGQWRRDFGVVISGSNAYRKVFTL
ncbi:Protein hir1 [Sphaceloma murrayae]|uniref:Protein hir1 n=1 Tax=Sphaceloma murrayae TaxID=2082308 RepID=A0A2K1R2Z4_9PEZI|nr:Protein hir1 [Sphaceloma murrayae]